METHPYPEFQNPDLADRLHDITERLHQEVSRLGMLQGAKSAEQQLSVLQGELESMGQLIAKTRSEISGLLPVGTPNSCLTSASDELDSVVSATERAAVEIMVAAERTQESAQRLRSVELPPAAAADLDTIDGAVMDIFMSCSFQDLTGQRIRKVVQALTYIEQRVTALTSLWRGNAEPVASSVPAWETRSDAHLLNGPSDAGLRQDAIDALLHAPAAVAASQDDVDALFA